MANQTGFISDKQMKQMESSQPQKTIDYSSQPGFISDSDMKEQARPKYANGLSEITPINQSPISGWDRMRMSAGQLGGSMSGTVSELKKMGYEVKRNKQDDLVIKDPKDGLWKMYDAKDPWSASRSIWENLKEVGADLLEIAPDVTAGAVQQAVALPFEGAAVISTFASGGAATPAAIAMVLGGQAAGAVAATATKTIMGKLAGTYESNPEEDFADLQRETLLNLGGGVIGVGVAPTAKVIGKQLSKLTDVLPPFDDATKAGLAKLFGTTTGVGEDAMQYGFKDGFKSVGDDLARFKGMPVGAIKDELKKTQVDLLADTAPRAFDVLKAAGKAEEEKVIAATTGEVVFKGKDLYETTLASMEHFLNFVSKEINPETGAKMKFSFADAQKYGLDKVNVVLKRDRELVRTAPGFITTDDGKSAINDVLKTVRKFSRINKEGSDGVKWGLEARRGVVDVLEDIQNKTLAAGSDVGRHFTVVKNNINNHFKNILDSGTDGAFSQYLNKYQEMATVLEPYTAAVAASKSSNNRMVAYETLVNRINSRAGANVYAKGAGDELTVLANNYAPELVEQIKNNLSKAELHGVTSKFADWTRPGLIGQSSATIGLGGIIAANPLVMGTAASGAVASSPRLAMKITPTMLRAAQQVKAITAAGGKKFSQLAKTNPIILQQLVETPFQVAQQEDSLQQQLGSAIQQAGGQR